MTSRTNTWLKDNFQDRDPYDWAVDLVDSLDVLVDNAELVFGTGSDVTMYYDGSNLIGTWATDQGGIQWTQTPSVSADNWGVNQITVTHQGSSKAQRGFRVNMECSTGGVTVGDMQAIHGRVTLSADDTTAANTSIHPGFFWLITEDGVTQGSASILAPVRAIFSPGTNDFRSGGDACALFYGQTWGTDGEIDAGIFMAAGASSTIDAAIETGGSGTFGMGLNFATSGNDGDTCWPFATMPIKDASSRYVRIFTGDSVTRAAVEAEYQTSGASIGYAGIGSLYISSGGEIYVRVNDAGAATDWEVVGHSAADTG